MENLVTDYTEVDPLNRIILVGDYQANFSVFDRSYNGRLSRDFGSGYFSGDILQQMEIGSYISASYYGNPGWITIFMLTDTLGLIEDIMSASGNAIGIIASKPYNTWTCYFQIFEIHNGAFSASPWNSVGTSFPPIWRYFRFVREGMTLSWIRYTDATYTTILATLSLGLQGASNYRYVQIGGGVGAGPSSALTMDSGIQNIELTPLAVPTVTTELASAIATDEATLNGTLDDDGGWACDCGFEWGETIAYGNTTPTQSRTTGQTFAQAITGLVANTPYHFRAFATNAAGTAYGADQEFLTLPAAPTVQTDPATEVS